MKIYIFALMGKIFEKIICSAILAMYVLAYAGIGVHCCKSGNNISLMIVAGDLSPESVHKHIHSECHCSSSHDTDCHGHCEGVHFHDPSCHTHVFAVTSSQDIDGNTKVATPDFPFTEWLPSVYSQKTVMNGVGFHAHAATAVVNQQELFSIWRI